MTRPHQNLLLLSFFCAVCVVLFVHVFVFPLYEGGARQRPLRHLGDYEQSLCSTTLRPVSVPAWWRAHCPRDGIVTVAQGGRLGNQMWEYASVWAVARRTGLEPYVPRCIRRVLDDVFDDLSVPPLGYVAHCPADWAGATEAPDAWARTNQSIVLPKFAVLPDLVLAWADDIRLEFKFKRRLAEASQALLRAARAAVGAAVGAAQAGRRGAADEEKRGGREHGGVAGAPGPAADTTFVGIHVRRTDYQSYLWRTRRAFLADAAYFQAAMDYFRNKYGDNVAFLVVSDDPAWCRHNLVRGRRDVFLVSKAGATSPGHDLAVMAACNHSIIDYGTFGVWGAILARGETILYNISRHSSTRISQLLPGWHVMN